METFISAFLEPINEVFDQASLLHFIRSFWATVLVCITLMATIIMRKSAVSFFESKAVYAPDEVLKKSKPFYIDKMKWDDILKKAQEYKVDHDAFSGHINLIKPYYFSDRKINYVHGED